jgi:hemerythrin-like domain-containing protein
MDTVATLSAEHAAILHVLEQVEQAAAAAEQGIPMPIDIFQDIQEFFSIFVDRCHHGKEEAEIFPRLQPGHAALIERLEAEHATGRHFVLDFTQALQSYQPGERVSGASLAAAARAYTTFLRVHIDQETQELLPVVEHALEAEDQEVVAGFERIEVERIGLGTHERLHTMIDGLAERIAPFLVTNPSEKQGVP